MLSATATDRREYPGAAWPPPGQPGPRAARETPLRSWLRPTRHGAARRWTGELTVLFLDLVGFTAFTHEEGDDAATTVARQLTRCARRSAGRGAAVVKSLGDGVMLAADAPATGLDTALCVLQRLDDERSQLAVAGGVHHGSVVCDDGDLFGHTVNLASRLADVARPGELWATAEVAWAASHKVPVGRQQLRGIASPVPTWAVTRPGRAPAHSGGRPG